MAHENYLSRKQSNRNQDKIKSNQINIKQNVENIFWLSVSFRYITTPLSNRGQIMKRWYLQEPISFRAYFRAEASLSDIHLLTLLRKSSWRK